MAGSSLALFGPIGFTELVVILVVVLILFGAGRLPEIGSGIGKAIKNFKKATSEPDAIDVTPKEKNQDDSPN
ncbi:MAG: twin-arginine translocase TatA/TatE family subunit, partial [Vicinamibacteria bacterium]